MIWQSSASRSIVKRLPEIFTSGAFRFLNQSIWSPSFLWDLRIDQPAKKDDGMILAAPTDAERVIRRMKRSMDKRATARSLRTREFKGWIAAVPRFPLEILPHCRGMWQGHR